MIKFFSIYITATLLIFGSSCWASESPQYHLTLYYVVDCPYSQKVIRHLNKTGVAIPMKELNQDYSYREELMDMTGNNQVPCLEINGEPMLESSDIIQWVDENLIHSFVE